MSGRISPSVLHAGQRMNEPDEESPSTSSRPDPNIVDDLRPLGRGRPGLGRGFGPVRRHVPNCITSPSEPRPSRPPPMLSPSVLGTAEERPSFKAANAFALPEALPKGGASSCQRAGPSSAGARCRKHTPPPVPSAPSTDSTGSLLSSVAGIGMDEAYGHDEQQLNDFLKLHPLCSMEACSRKTLQLVANAFDKATVRVPDV